MYIQNWIPTFDREACRACSRPPIIEFTHNIILLLPLFHKKKLEIARYIHIIADTDKAYHIPQELVL
jgi:hypothetical protein